MAKRMIWSVEPRKGGKWAVQRDGTKRADSLHERKETALERSVELGTRHRGQVRVKGRDGTIQDERTYGRDPHPPKG